MNGTRILIFRLNDGNKIKSIMHDNSVKLRNHLVAVQTPFQRLLLKAMRARVL